jgi:hypothetical protein
MTDDKQPHFVPAGPGYRRLELIRPNGGFKVHRQPIVAWEMRPGPDRPNTNSFAHPVTPVWSRHRDAVVAIFCPDNTVCLTNGTSFANEAEWLAHAVDEARAREEV